MKNGKLRYYMRGLGIGILVTTVILGIAGKDTEPMTDTQIRERAAELGMVDSNALVLSELQNHSEKSETEGQSKTECETETETQDETETQSKADSGTETETGTQDETEMQSKTDSGTETGTQDETETQGKTDPGTETETETGTQDETETQSKTDSGTTTETETGTQDVTETQNKADSQIENESQKTEKVSLTIKAGASSDIVSKDLAAAGLVADAKTFDTYLCDNGYSQSIRVGTYEISPGTSEEEIAKIITEKH